MHNYIIPRKIRIILDWICILHASKSRDKFRAFSGRVSMILMFNLDKSCTTNILQKCCCKFIYIPCTLVLLVRLVICKCVGCILIYTRPVYIYLVISIHVYLVLRVLSNWFTPVDPKLFGGGEESGRWAVYDHVFKSSE